MHQVNLRGPLTLRLKIGSLNAPPVRRLRCRKTVVFLLALAAASLTATGCALPRRTFQPQVDPGTLDDVAFLHYLATVPVVTVDEGTRAVLMLIDSNAGRMTFNERSIVLQRMGAVKAAWRLGPRQILDKGTLAYMLRTIGQWPRGLAEVLAAATGWGDRRYALKTCVDAGWIAYGLPHDPVTGGELLSALTAAEPKLPSSNLKLP